MDYYEKNKILKQKAEQAKEILLEDINNNLEARDILDLFIYLNAIKRSKDK